MARSGKNKISEDNYLLSGSEISGNIITESNIRIDGRLFGNLKSAQKLFLSNSGTIKGDVDCENAFIEGILDGNLNVKNELYLSSEAKITGSVLTAKVILEDGGQILGKLKLKKYLG